MRQPRSFGGDRAGLSGLASTQTNLIDRSNDVIKTFVLALDKFSGALGLERDSSLVGKFENCGAGKICTDSDDIERIESQAKEVGEKVEQLKKDGVKLSADASKIFSEGLIPYGKGLLKGGLLGVDIAAFSSQATNAIIGNPLNVLSVLSQLPAFLVVIKQIPPIISTFSGANGAIYDYASYNGIEKPEDTGPE